MGATQLTEVCRDIVPRSNGILAENPLPSCFRFGKIGQPAGLNQFMTFPSPTEPVRQRERARSRPARPRKTAPPQRQTTFQWIVLVMFALLLVASIALTVWKIGPAPVRALIAIALLAIIGAKHIDVLRLSTRRSRPLLLLGLAMAVLGTVVSVFNGTSFAVILSQLIEIHVQAAINIVLGGAVIMICGRKAVLQCILFAVGLSSLFAIAQAVGFEPAWTLRGLIGNLQGEVFEKYGFFYDRRPMGLSLSPILLATQLCLAFAAVGVYYERKIRPVQYAAVQGKVFENGVLIALVLFIIVCFVSGNRSPILGALVFFGIYTIFRRPKYFIILAPFAVVLAVWILPQVISLAADTGSRVVQTGDASSEGRATLIYYGLLLFKGHPFGFGFDFDPTRYWQTYWSDVQDMPNPGAIIVYPLHNYALMMLCFYGFPLLFFLPTIFKMLWQQRTLLVYFVPYVIHIAFHNTGPFWNDFMIWFVTALGTSVAVRSQPETAPNGRPPLRDAKGSPDDQTGKSRRRSSTSFQPR